VTRGPTEPPEAQPPTPPDHNPPGGEGAGRVRLPGPPFPQAASRAHGQAAPLSVAKPAGQDGDTWGDPRASQPTAMRGGTGSRHPSAQPGDCWLADLCPDGESVHEAATAGSRCMAPRASAGSGRAGESRTRAGGRVRGLVAGQWRGGLRSARHRRGMTSNAASRRLAESRMRANRTYGSRWQGVETRTLVPGATP
jgi:hypothetical protein